MVTYLKRIQNIMRLKKSKNKKLYLFRIVA